jgi:hypothetical protein
MRITWKFPWRGADEEFSNTYWFTPSPGTRNQWHVLIFGYVLPVIIPAFTAEVELVKVDCYIGSGSPAVQHFDASTDPTDFPVVGTLPFTASATEVMCTGDSAAWMRFATGRHTSRGKPIYIRQYYHHMVVTPPDTIHVDQKEALEDLGGFLVGGLTTLPYYLCDGFGNIVSNPTVPTYITHRDLERRGSSPL